RGRGGKKYATGGPARPRISTKFRGRRERIRAPPASATGDGRPMIERSVVRGRPRDDVELRPPVPRPGGLVARRIERTLLTVAHDLEAALIQAEPDQVLLRRVRPAQAQRQVVLRGAALVRVPRSEEHTSELQSRENLVCRLLLEKKKISTHE